jgi:hypothetical protein
MCTTQAPGPRGQGIAPGGMTRAGGTVNLCPRAPRWGLLRVRKKAPPRNCPSLASWRGKFPWRFTFFAFRPRRKTPPGPLVREKTPLAPKCGKWPLWLNPVPRTGEGGAPNPLQGSDASNPRLRPGAWGPLCPPGVASLAKPGTCVGRARAPHIPGVHIPLPGGSHILG